MVLFRLINALKLLRFIDAVMLLQKPTTLSIKYRNEMVKVWIGVGTAAESITQRCTQLAERNAVLEELIKNMQQEGGA